jgi:hypothetical protein
MNKERQGGQDQTNTHSKEQGGQIDPNEIREGISRRQFLKSAAIVSTGATFVCLGGMTYETLPYVYRKVKITKELVESDKYPRAEEVDHAKVTIYKYRGKEVTDPESVKEVRKAQRVLEQKEEFNQEVDRRLGNTDATKKARNARIDMWAKVGLSSVAFMIASHSAFLLAREFIQFDQSCLTGNPA